VRLRPRPLPEGSAGQIERPAHDPSFVHRDSFRPSSGGLNAGTESALRVTQRWAISRDGSTHVTVDRSRSR
jgi:hypothetical protein